MLQPSDSQKRVQEVAEAALRDMPESDAESQLLSVGHQIGQKTGYAVKLRTCLKGPSVSVEEDLHHLRNTFLVAQPRQGCELLVELNFRSHFEVGHRNAYLEQAIEELPVVFVGCLKQVVQIVRLLCCEFEKAYAQQGLTLPPWRCHDSMESLWNPARCLDRLIHDHGEDDGGSCLCHQESKARTLELWMDGCYHPSTPERGSDCSAFDSMDEHPRLVIYGFHTAAC